MTWKMHFRALALSLMETRTNSLASSADGVSQRQGDASDDQQFEQDLQRAIEASKAESRERLATAPSPKSQSTQGRTGTSPSGSRTFLSGRAQLEKERLARLKRYRGESDGHEDAGGLSERTPVKRPRLSSVEPTDRRLTQLQSASSTSSTSSGSRKPGMSDSKTTGMQTVPATDQLFWDGELRPTANKHSLPREDGKATFRLSEVLGPVRTR